MQSWVPDSLVWRSYNGLAWFLSTLLFSYLMVPVAQRLFSRIGERKRGYFILIIVQAFIISTVLGVVIQDNVEYWLYAFPPVRLLDFYSGYALAKIYKMHDSTASQKTLSYTIIEALLVISVVVLMVVYPFVNAGFRRQALYFPISLCLVYVFARGKGSVSKILSTKWIVEIGNNSFYYYISHQVIFKWIYKIYARTPFIEIRSFMLDFLLVILCLIITFWSKKIYDHFIARMRNARIA